MGPAARFNPWPVGPTERQRIGGEALHTEAPRRPPQGANFLLRTIPDEAFTFREGSRHFSPVDDSALFPYMLVNIGSGVSIIQVDEHGHQRISGTNIGGGASTHPQCPASCRKS
jgi:type II pantothenate kinase